MGKEMNLVIFGNPVTKKNSQRIVRNPSNGRYFVLPSKQYKEYESTALYQLEPYAPILPKATPCCVKCEYFMQTKRKVDLVNLLEATDDILVRAGILADDNSEIIVSHDGSRVHYDKENPRVKITIKNINLEDENA